VTTMVTNTNTAISLIIATRNRRESIDRLLTRLVNITWPSHWELIVVDNGSSDGSIDVIRQHLAQLPLSIFHEPRAGKSYALNLALAHAQGDLIVFCDDDVMPPDAWLVEWEQVSKQYPACNIFGGRIKINRARVPGWIIQSHNLQEMLLSEHDLGEMPVTYPFDRYPLGPNMAVRRSALEGEIDPWPVDFGPGTRIPLGDEYAFLSKLSSPSDRDRLYVPAPVLVHTPKPLSFSSALQRCFLGGLAAGRLTETATPGSRQGSLWQLTRTRLRQNNSLKELVCVCSRAGGYSIGRLV